MEVTLKKFYNDKKLIILHENYDKFISQLALILGVPNNMFCKYFLHYSEGDRKFRRL